MSAVIKLDIALTVDLRTDALVLDTDDAIALGDFYPRLRRMFTALGGRLEDCPFGHDYTGPVIRWNDEGWPFMYSSEQKELFDEGSI